MSKIITGEQWLSQQTEQMMSGAQVYRVLHSDMMLAEIPGSKGIYLWAMASGAALALRRLRHIIRQHFVKQLERLEIRGMQRAMGELRKENAELARKVAELDSHLNPKPWTQSEAAEALWSEVQRMDDEDSLRLAEMSAGGRA